MKIKIIIRKACLRGFTSSVFSLCLSMEGFSYVQKNNQQIPMSSQTPINPNLDPNFNNRQMHGQIPTNPNLDPNFDNRQLNGQIPTNPNLDPNFDNRQLNGQIPTNPNLDPNLDPNFDNRQLHGQASMNPSFDSLWNSEPTFWRASAAGAALGGAVAAVPWIWKDFIGKKPKLSKTGAGLALGAAAIGGAAGLTYGAFSKLNHYAQNPGSRRQHVTAGAVALAVPGALAGAALGPPKFITRTAKTLGKMGKVVHTVGKSAGSIGNTIAGKVPKGGSAKKMILGAMFGLGVGALAGGGLGALLPTRQ